MKKHTEMPDDTVLLESINSEVIKIHGSSKLDFSPLYMFIPDDLNPAHTHVDNQPDSPGVSIIKYIEQNTTYLKDSE